MALFSFRCYARRRLTQGAPVDVSTLRHPSDRPSVVVAPAAFVAVDPTTGSIVGRPGPLGRERSLFALPLDPGPALLSPATVIRNAAYIADPAGALIGVDSVWVSRMLTARWTEDTRRL